MAKPPADGEGRMAKLLRDDSIVNGGILGHWVGLNSGINSLVIIGEGGQVTHSMNHCPNSLAERWHFLFIKPLVELIIKFFVCPSVSIPQPSIGVHVGDKLIQVQLSTFVHQRKRRYLQWDWKCLKVCVDLYNRAAWIFVLSLPDDAWRPPGIEAHFNWAFSWKLWTSTMLRRRRPW